MAMAELEKKKIFLDNEVNSKIVPGNCAANWTNGHVTLNPVATLPLQR